MAKTIETVRTLVERAERKGVAIKRARQRDMWGVGDLQEVYRVENDGKHVELYHYETLTAKVDIEKKQIVSIYGESRSDADSVETFLDTVGIKNVAIGYKPVNGGFYAQIQNIDNDYRNRKDYYWDTDGEKAMIQAINEAQKEA